ncbi:MULTISPECIES: glycosyltransferase family 2 protein [unclassified Ensifer]|uniref:glycosyltransferase family 2 protein n=1 Tax=unclassified Ensifer TaxID=2633371 RepID=UPI0008130CDC|nr:MULTISPECIES: glycosyltransferase family 2 protein [unclassified Ensifer]OCP03409.1 glycosyl transferase family A [Ensifer sp. LC14]OCP03741.1 glycosyl transferase family A [Ensifer sp. LC11]OCP03890.1 glycosyl transferase family A [Ensifer sp. LC13]OCP30322.1 glycosyl transferase family A [Ensifer sp. LC499]
MTPAAKPEVCVIIAAKDAQATIARAIASALREPETAEVIVVDDGSADETATAARHADDQSGRLTVIRFESNRGPAAARNHAISVSRSPVLAVLDADDFFLPGRLGRLLCEKDWDFIADNIAFMDEAAASAAPAVIDHFPPQPRNLHLIDFVDGNISRRNARRGEIGFLKPLVRRDFLEGHSIRYRETLRLGEDYDLYLRALAKGARYKIIHSCGYAAIVRSNSLSGSHRTEDLKRLYEADRNVLAVTSLDREATAAIRRHERHVRGRYQHRHFLDLKNQQGAKAAIGYLLRKPEAIAAVTMGILADKTERFRHSREEPIGLGGSGGLRYLLSDTVNRP